MKKILFISTTLGGGGAERIMSYLINDICNNTNYKPTLLLVKREGNSYLSEIPPNLDVIMLDLKCKQRYWPLFIIKSILKIRPDLCYVGLVTLNILLAPFLPILKLFGIKTIVRETSVLSQIYGQKNVLFLKFLYRLFYNFYDIIISQSIDMKEDLINNWGIQKKRIRLINNPIDIEQINKKSHQACPMVLSKSHLNMIAVGRLSHQKGYDILLQRMAELLPNIPFKLYILGTGELYSKIKQLITSLNLEDYVVLLGYQLNPYSIIRQSNGLILSSRHEGFPNVLLEANALGIPVLSNKCPGGVNEIVIEGVNGFSCDFNNSNSFKNSLSMFLKHKFNGETIKSITKSRYDSNIIIKKYIEVFEGCL